MDANDHEKYFWCSSLSKAESRLRSEPLKLIGSAMFGATLNLHGYTCQTTVSFGKLKDGTVVNSLAWSSCFSYRSVSQNNINALSKIFFRSRPTTHFLLKSTKFRVVRTSMWYNTLEKWPCFKGLWRDFS